MNCADYHYHNFKCPVLFEQVFRFIPKDAIVIEVGPHGLLTSILKKEMGPEATCISLVDRNSKDNLQFFYSSIGKVFINGGQPSLVNYYNQVSFPVGRGTHNFGSLVKWDHSTKWFTPFYKSNRSFGKKVTVNTSWEEYAYLQGHNIDGRVLMAATGYLEIVWKLIADLNAQPVNQVPIIFENVKFLRATILPNDQDVEFWVNIMRQSGYFEIYEGGSVCCSGTARLPKQVSDEFINPEVPKFTPNGHQLMKKEDVYKWFHLKRYLYGGLFQGIEEVDVNGTYGKLKWNNSFTSLLDTMLQVSLVPVFSNDLVLPTRVQKIVLDPVQHLAEVDQETNELSVYVDKDLKLVKCGAIEITNMETTMAPKRQHIQAEPVLESHMFIPYINDSTTKEVNLDLNLKVALQIIIENTTGLVSNLYGKEIVATKDNSLIKKVEDIAKNEPVVRVNFANSSADNVDFILLADGTVAGVNLGSLKQDGFVLFHGSLQDADVASNLAVVYQNTFKGSGIFLLKKLSPLPQCTAVVKVTNSQLNWLEDAKEALKQNSSLVLYSENDDVSGIMGLTKCLQLEPLEKAVSVKCVFIRDQDAPKFDLKDEFYRTQMVKGLTINVLRQGVWGSYRHLPITKAEAVEVPHACNYIETVGDLSTFKWFELPSHYHKFSPKSELIDVFYSALNFKDVMVSAGKIPSVKTSDPSAVDIFVGFEFSGVSQAGKRVMGMSYTPSISLQLISDPLFTWEVPDGWSLEEAATVPVVYATCYYALILRGQMQQGDSILIHAGAGGVGIAAISIALSMNCQVFTTVGSKEKREFLLQLFPQLKPDNIGNSRSSSFEHVVMRNTKGRGVDLVLNSLSADLMQASIRCIAERGRFLEIGKVDSWAGTPISTSVFAKNTSCHGVHLDNLFFDDSSEVKQEIHRLVAQGITKGTIRPLPTTVFNEDQVEDAYRFLSTGKHKGKVLIKIRPEEPNILQRPQRTIQAVPRLYFSPEKSYILIGGLGGFALELTKFLIKRCARKIVLNSRRGVWNGYQALCLKKWSETQGVSVRINCDDTSSLQGAEALVKEAEQMGPVGGVFNMALALNDGLFVNQTSEAYQAVFKSKIYSGLNMDQVTRARCHYLDYFVAFSSIASGRGNPGQTNYGMANSAMERLCEKRLADGLPGLAVQYGPVGEVGAVAQATKYDKTLAVVSLTPQTISSCISCLETFLLQPYAVGSTFVVNEQHSSSLEASGKTPVETVAHILGIKDIGLIDQKQPLSQLGIDSLMLAEIKQTLYRNFNIELAPEDIRDLTFEKVTQLTEGPNDPKAEASQPTFTSISPMLSKEPLREISSDKAYKSKVFFIHPIEGNVEVMVPLAQQLKANVYGLEATKQLDCIDLKTAASAYVEEIRKVQEQGPYLVCGYSYGCALGLEIAMQLEKAKEEVKLVLVDGAPAFVKRILHEMYSKNDKSDVKTRINIYRSFAMMFDGVDQDKVNKTLDEPLKWEEHVEQIVALISDATAHNAEDIAASADRFMKRVFAGYLYQPSDTFKGQAILFRSDDIYFDLPKDYGLQELCKQPITLEILAGNHREVLQGKNMHRIAEIINTLV